MKRADDGDGLPAPHLLPEVWTKTHPRLARAPLGLFIALHWLCNLRGRSKVHESGWDAASYM